MAAIVMIFEMTLDYSVIVPMTITVALSYGIRSVLSPDSIYTLKSRRRGHYTPDGLRTSPHLVRRARDLVQRCCVATPSETVERCACGPHAAAPRARVRAGDPARRRRHRGLRHQDGDAAGARRQRPIADTRLAGHSPPRDRTADRLALEIMVRLSRTGLPLVLVVDDGNGDRPEHVEGAITRERLADAMVEAADLFAD
jgi:CIC family chloride channel protein